MTTEQILKSMIESGNRMRISQKEYFIAKTKEGKKEWLITAKQAEREFDNVLFNAKQLIKK